MAELQAESTRYNADVSLQRSRVEVTGAARVGVGPTLSSLIKLIPTFDESQVSEFFLRFEKKAAEHGWSENKWAALVSSKLTGKALKAYDALQLHECTDYWVLKTTVLRAYELQPETYRLKFRNLKKGREQSFREYARDVTEALGYWTRAEKADTFEELKQLILKEQFYKSMGTALSISVKEKQPGTIEEAAELADLRVSLIQGCEAARGDLEENRPTVSQKGQPRGGSNAGTPGARGRGQQSQRENSESPRTGGVRCYRCQGRGHIAINCPEGDASRGVGQGTTAAAVQVVSVESGESGEGAVAPERPVCHAVTHVQEGKRDVLCPSPDPFRGHRGGAVAQWRGRWHELRMLRDSGASQTLLRNFTGQPINAARVVVVRGINATRSYPLVRMRLRVGEVEKELDVGVVEELPVEGIDLLLGNDLGCRLRP